ncbi:MAG TPA: ATP-dependent DNA helicase RecG [Caulobacteraceae bacterium]|nr:ATP-dependent DNA helicase RecG [Caulobacteraceae bacterium]
MRPEILFPLFAPVTSIRGVGARLAKPLERLAGPRVRDVLFLAPTALVKRRATTVREAHPGEVATLTLTIDHHQRPRRFGQPWRIRASDRSGGVNLIWFKGYGPHLETSNPPGSVRIVSGKIEPDAYGGGLQIIHPDYFLPPERAAEVRELEPVYPLTEGLTFRVLQRLVREALTRAPDLSEWIDPAFIAAQNWPTWKSSVEKLHAPTGEADIAPHAPHRRRLAFDELLAHQLALGGRKRRRRSEGGAAIGPSAVAERVRAALPFSLTGDQTRALAEVRADLGEGARMTRLLQGDVGSGKTVVAMLAMADVAAAGRQSALMAPTEILARQHFDTLAPPLRQAGVETVLLTGRDKGAGRRKKLELLSSGAAAVAVGTHALFQDEVAFANLALTVIDEQHRFGVNERARLQAKGEAAHFLAMSATPIPRTLELTLYGDLDVSRIRQKPPGRTPVDTRAAPMTRLGQVVERLRQAIDAGAQAYWICPLIEGSEDSDLAAAEARAAALKQTLGAERVGLIHGRLPAAEKDQAMADFAEGRTAVLVATTVVEVGMDVPAASIMVIEQAERFGLAQLHQLRGRVGRGAAASSCVLLYDHPLSDIASRRLDILRRTQDGFVIAEKDLELRGGGDPLGLRQSGFPDYRLADPIAHGDLVRAAADHARLILSRFPGLQGEGAAPARVLTGLFDWRPEGGEAG